MSKECLRTLHCRCCGLSFLARLREARLCYRGICSHSFHSSLQAVSTVHSDSSDGILADVLLGGIFYLLMQHEPAVITMLPPLYLAATAVAVLLFGVIMTVSCAYISVEQFLRMRGNDLYFI